MAYLHAGAAGYCALSLYRVAHKVLAIADRIITSGKSGPALAGTPYRLIV